MDYDGAGNLQNISVRGSDADKLLKAIQATESGRYGRLVIDREEVENYALYDYDTEGYNKTLSISQKKAANATFIYAMTKAQQEEILAGYGSAFAFLVPAWSITVIIMPVFRWCISCWRAESRS